MIRILKEGKKFPKTVVLFKKKCLLCKCEFEFETEDCEYVERSMYRKAYEIKCPCCGLHMKGSDIYNLEHRAEEIIEGGEQ